MSRTNESVVSGQWRVRSDAPHPKGCGIFFSPTLKLFSNTKKRRGRLRVLTRQRGRLPPHPKGCGIRRFLSDKALLTDHWPLTTGHSRGFTLVELMLVIIIIGVLAAMVVPRLAGRTEQAKVARANADIAAIGLALDLYELDLGSYPSSLEDLVRRDPPSDFDEESAEWNGPYLKKGLPNDPWGRPYSYNRESQHQQDYDLASLGPDGQAGNDDVTNWD